MSTTNERKRKWISENVGNCCILCGYNKCNRALELHHTKETSFKKRKNKKGMRLSMNSMTWQDIYDDAPHMVVLCSNCHREVHEGMHPEISVPEHTTSGKRQQGNPPFGYKWKDGKHVKDEEAWQYRKRIYEMYKQGLGWSQMCKILNTENIPSQRGGKWHPTVVMRLCNTMKKGDL